MKTVDASSMIDFVSTWQSGCWAPVTSSSVSLFDSFFSGSWEGVVEKSTVLQGAKSMPWSTMPPEFVNFDSWASGLSWTSFWLNLGSTFVFKALSSGEMAEKTVANGSVARGGVAERSWLSCPAFPSSSHDSATPVSRSTKKASEYDAERGGDCPWIVRDNFASLVESWWQGWSVSYEGGCNRFCYRDHILRLSKEARTCARFSFAHHCILQTRFDTGQWPVKNLHVDVQ